MKNENFKEIETLFFESIILDIDFSHWENHVQLVIGARWIYIDGETCPADDIYSIKFICAKNFSCVWKGGNDENCKNDDLKISPGIEVNGVKFAKKSADTVIIVDAMRFENLEITFERYETRILAKHNINAMRSLMQSKTKSDFLRPDIDSVARCIFKKSKNNA